LQRGIFIVTVCAFARRGFTHDVSIVRSIAHARARPHIINANTPSRNKMQSGKAV